MNFHDYLESIKTKTALLQFRAEKECKKKGHDWSFQKQLASKYKGGTEVDTYYTCKRCNRSGIQRAGSKRITAQPRSAVWNREVRRQQNNELS